MEETEQGEEDIRQKMMMDTKPIIQRVSFALSGLFRAVLLNRM